MSFCEQSIIDIACTRGIDRDERQVSEVGAFSGLGLNLAGINLIDGLHYFFTEFVIETKASLHKETFDIRRCLFPYDRIDACLGFSLREGMAGQCR